MTKTNLLYLGLSPIQNSRPYEIMHRQKAISTTILYVHPLKNANTADEENITKAAFTQLPTTTYAEYFLSNNFNQKTLVQQLAEVKKWINKNDIVVVYGHYHRAFHLAILLTKWLGKKLILTTDATYIEGTAASKGLKLQLKPLFLQCLYNTIANGVFVPSTAAKNFLISQKIKEENIVITPYVVNEDLIASTIQQTNQQQIRHQYNTNDDDIVFVFCAKFIDRKRPLDAIKAFAKLSNNNTKLWLIGSGPLLLAMQQLVDKLELNHRVIFCGIVPYENLASLYVSANCLVFTSSHEPYGLPVNEAMLCSIPVIVSDKIGARLDLVEQEKTGWVYSCGNIHQLQTTMEKACNKELLKEMGMAAKQKMTTWSSEVNVQQQLNYFAAKQWLKN